MRMFAAVIKGVIFASFIIIPNVVVRAVKERRYATAVLAVIRTPIFLIICLIPSFFGVNAWMGFGLVYAIGAVVSIILDPVAKQEYETAA